jgi:nitrate/nitrite transport system substrate-binding protein
MRAVFPKDAARRAFLKSVGAATALAALAQVFPLKAATEAFAEGAPLEKKDLKIGFIPITCATPIIMAHPMGFYSKHGLNVEVIKTAGWAVIRDKTLNKEYDAAHMLSPMPLAITLGVGSNPIPYTMPAVENINGQAITLAIKHKDKNDPKAWKGFKFAVPFDYSMHNYLLRYYVAEHGLDPDTDIQIRAVPPPEMVANLRADNIDGFLGPDPFNQRAVYDGAGFIHLLSKEIWDGHPCCAFAASKEFVATMPNTYAALLRAIIDATAFAGKGENRKAIAAAIAPANYLNQPQTVLEQILTGTYADGLGNVKRDPSRIDFDPFPWQSFAVWILTQMKRWGQLKGDVDYKSVAEQVFLATDAAKLMREAGLAVPETSSKTLKVMGKEFDPGKPDAYIASFAIRRA